MMRLARSFSNRYERRMVKLLEELKLVGVSEDLLKKIEDTLDIAYVEGFIRAWDGFVKASSKYVGTEKDD